MKAGMLSYAEVAAMVGKSVSTVQRWVKDGAIPFHRTGRTVWFNPAEIREWLRNNEVEGDNRITPVRPLKRHGVQHVYPSQTLGDDAHCWCGDALDHDWTGKDRGAPHPHEHERMQQVVVVDRHEEDPAHRIARKDLRGFHATLKDFLMGCVNDDGLGWRQTTNGVLLYPPDDSQPISVYARNNDGQMRSLNQWYAAHVEPMKKATGEALAQLAETVNDPAEHPPSKDSFSPPKQDDAAFSEEYGKTVDAPPWEPYINRDDVVSETYETDGTTVRCRLCHGTDAAYETPATDVRGLGGHVRMHHRDTSTLRTPESIAKSLDSRRYNRLHEKVTAAVELLAETIGFTGDPELEKENERLRHEVEKEKKRADDAQARLQLLQEAFKGLD